MKKIIISRTDSIGDVVLTLPMAGVLKELYPEHKIVFLGRKYTKDVIELSKNVDEFVDWDEINSIKSSSEQIERFKKIAADAIIHVFPKRLIAKLAKEAGIPMRIGTTNRVYHWFYCNYISMLSRKNSNLHESLLNLELLKSFGIKHKYTLDDIPKYYGLNTPEPLPAEIQCRISTARFKLIIHPKSKGSAREWNLENYKKLISLLSKEGVQVFITGTEEEGIEIRKHIKANDYSAIDLTGKLTLKELISLINSCDGFISASTGPLHIAAALGKLAIGLYPPIRPMHPGRWAPIGILSSFIVKDIKCNKCLNSRNCECLNNISPEEVKDKLLAEM